MNVANGSGDAHQESEQDRERRQPEQQAVHFVAIRAAANDVQDRQPHEMGKQHHPRNERCAHPQEYFCKTHGPIVVHQDAHILKPSDVTEYRESG